MFYFLYSSDQPRALNGLLFMWYFTEEVFISVQEIDTLISGERKKSIQDVLNIEEDKRPRTATKRQTSLEQDKQHYSVEISSIARGDKKGRLG